MQCHDLCNAVRQVHWNTLSLKNIFNTIDLLLFARLVNENIDFDVLVGGYTHMPITEGELVKPLRVIKHPEYNQSKAATQGIIMCI